MPDQRLRSRDRITLQADVDRLKSDGLRASNAVMTVWILPNGLGRPRLACRAGRAVGNAVKRNKLRRRVREAFRRSRDVLPCGVDVLCSIRPGGSPGYAAVREALVSLTVRALARRPARRCDKSQTGDR
ncbi:MAG: ribonuclease P protein component [Phycisphaerales bacterium]|nr:ribonuclease P protein component [Phycisphaerales bacterium]